MISALSWIPVGACNPVSMTADHPFKEDLELLKTAILGTTADTDVDADAEAEVDDDDASMEVDDASESAAAEVSHALAAAAALGDIKGSGLQDIADGLRELDMDNYDDEDEGISSPTVDVDLDTLISVLCVFLVHRRRRGLAAHRTRIEFRYHFTPPTDLPPFLPFPPISRVSPQITDRDVGGVDAERDRRCRQWRRSQLEADGRATQPALIAVQLNDLIRSGRLRKGSVVQLVEYMCSFIQQRRDIWIHWLLEYSLFGRDCLERMWDEDGLQVDGVVLLGMLAACAHGGLVEEGLEIFAETDVGFGVVPEHEHYCYVADMLCWVGRLEEVVGVIRGMPMRPRESVWGSLLMSCRNYGNVAFAEMAVGEFEKLKSGADEGIYALGS